MQKSTQDQVSYLSKQAIGAGHLKESGYEFDEDMKESDGGGSETMGRSLHGSSHCGWSVVGVGPEEKSSGS